jgi:hypothetical protein
MAEPIGYAVFVQPFDDRITPENAEQYGSVHSFDELYGDAASGGKDFCDGQVSPTGPRYADDRMGSIWFYSRDAAEYASGMLRNNIASDIMDGTTPAPAVLPDWLKPLMEPSGITAAEIAMEALFDALEPDADEDEE